MKKKLNSTWYLLYTIIITLFSFVLWNYAGYYSLAIMMAICAIILVVFNDIRLGVPFFLNLLFTNGSEAAKKDIDIWLIAGALSSLLGCLIFMIRNKFKLKYNRFGLSFLSLAIASIIPLFWVKYSEFAYHIIYYGWFLYFIIYILFSNYFKSDVSNEFSIAMEGLGTLLALECIVSIFKIKNAGGNLEDIYTLGWGICNEAGIVMLVCLPFCLYRLYNNIKTKEVIVDLFFFIIICTGIVFTLSRGTIGFAILEIGLTILCLLLYNKKYKTTIGLIGFGILIIGILAYWKRGYISEHIVGLIENNGRFTLYKKGLSSLNETPLYWVFGAGFTFAIDYKGAVMVCHSTIYETLTIMGLFGAVLLLIHFALKYTLVLRRKDTFNMIMFAGFLTVDLYGLIDNTYHMYYYMVPLAMILAVVEKHNDMQEVVV